MEKNKLAHPMKFITTIPMLTRSKIWHEIVQKKAEVFAFIIIFLTPIIQCLGIQQSSDNMTPINLTFLPKSDKVCHHLFSMIVAVGFNGITLLSWKNTNSMIRASKTEFISILQWANDFVELNTYTVYRLEHNNYIMCAHAWLRAELRS